MRFESESADPSCPQLPDLGSVSHPLGEYSIKA